MDNNNKLKTFHCGVDVTYNTWVYVEAENEMEAEKKAIHQAHENHGGDSISAYNSFSHGSVHAIYEDD